MESGNTLKIRNIEKIFQINDEFLQALENVNAEIKDGEFISIVGPSGCGKSTLIRMIAGLESPTNGEITLNEKVITKPSLDIGMIFQESRLFPWLTIEKNIEFGISDKSKSRAEKKKLAEEMISLVGLTGFSKALPKQLSGGMQQRASIARGLINKPKILLLDEPFGALDAFTRMNMQDELLRIRKEKNMTMVMVTHDVDEAVYLANKIVVMSPRPAKIEEIITVEHSYPRDRNNDEFIALRSRILKVLNFAGKEKEAEYYI